MADRHRAPRLRLGAVWIAAATGVGLLHLAGSGPLAPPTLTSLAGIAAWARRCGPLDVAFVAIRLLAMLAGGYLLAITTLVACWATRPRRPPLRSAPRRAPPGTRTLLLVLAAGAATGAAAAPAAAFAGSVPPPAAPAPTLRAAVPTPPSAEAPTLRAAVPTPPSAEAPTLRAAGPIPPSAPAPVRHRAVPAARAAPAPTLRRPPETAVDGAKAELPAPPSAAAMWTVRPGDSFWSIAAARLRAHLGRRANDAEIARYWVALVAANRARLPVPDDPDLLFSGDRLVLPPPVPAG